MCLLVGVAAHSARALISLRVDSFEVGLCQPSREGLPCLTICAGMRSVALALALAVVRYVVTWSGLPCDVGSHRGLDLVPRVVAAGLSVEIMVMIDNPGEQVQTMAVKFVVLALH